MIRVPTSPAAVALDDLANALAALAPAVLNDM